ncbi:MAG: BatD family protein [Spirochaetaceae bacterium]|jgi:hypothetical protein|nr:BatD family protein [Spirochaetaceae bacterium]
MASKKTILFCAAALFFAPRLSAQDDFKVLLEFLPDSVTQNEAFTINLVVSCPNPEYIYVRPPNLNDAFRIERMRTEVRLVSDIARNSDQYTVFEFLLIPDKAGLQEIGAFEVEVLGKTKTSSPINLYVQAAEETFEARLDWLGRNGRTQGYNTVSAGEACEAALRIISWGKNIPYPETFEVPIEVPENAIVEKIPVSKSDRNAGIVLRLRIVPLDGKTVNINAQSVEYEKTRIEIPALTINVLPAKDKPASMEAREAPIIKNEYAASAAPQVGPVSFSGMVNDNKIIDVFREEAGRRIEKAERLWEREKYADALAVLRNAEVTLSAAGAVRKVRAMCENALHLPPGAGEPWLPRAPMVFVLILTAAAFTILFFNRKKFFISVHLFSAILFVFALDAAALVFSYAYEKTRAVLKYCAAYPIPEDNVKAAFFFMEGETVHIRSKSGLWLYVESTEIGSPKKSGWIEKENAVILAYSSL